MITRREYHKKNPIPFILTTLLIVSTVGLFVFGEKATQHTSAEEVVAVDYRQQFINNIEPLPFARTTFISSPLNW